jgi:hypothetical protein
VGLTARDEGSRIETLHKEPQLVVAEIAGIMLVVWRKRATVDSVPKLDEGCRSLVARNGQFSTIHVVRGNVSLPDQETRAALQAFSERWADKVIASCVVLLGNGFWASAMRALVMTLRWGRAMQTTSKAHKVHMATDVSEAAEWLAPRHSEQSAFGIEPHELERALRQLLEVRSESPR